MNRNKRPITVKRSRAQKVSHKQISLNNSFHTVSSKKRSIFTNFEGLETKKRCILVPCKTFKNRINKRFYNIYSSKNNMKLMRFLKTNRKSQKKLIDLDGEDVIMHDDLTDQFAALSNVSTKQSDQNSRNINIFSTN